jgi:hypothetical protein
VLTHAAAHASPSAKALVWLVVFDDPPPHAVSMLTDRPSTRLLIIVFFILSQFIFLELREDDPGLMPATLQVVRKFCVRITLTGLI